MAIPSRRWFPATLQDRAAWFDNFNTQMQAVGASLGFTIGELNGLGEDNQLMQFFGTSTTTLEAYRDAVRQFRLVMTEGDIGDPTPAFPADIVFAPPLGSVETGIFERLAEAVERIRAAPAYTDETGALLQIIPSTPEEFVEEDLKPVIKASQSFSDYKFTLNVTRLGQEAYKAQILRDGNGGWTDNGFATANPFEVSVTPTTPGKPERIQVRAILLKKNEPVGQPSDPTYVTVNP